MPIADLIDKDDRAWLDWRWCWLAERIGVDRIRSVEVRGRIEAFVRSDQPVTEPQMQRLAEVIAEMLGITDMPVLVIVGSTQTILEDDELSAICKAAKEQDPRSIVMGVDREDLADPRIAGYFLMKRIIFQYLEISGWLGEEDEDGWEVAELAAVQFGVGNILANNVHVDQNTTFGTMHQWKGYHGTMLSEELLAYALARFAYLRQELPPSWQSFLRTAPRKTFTHCLVEFETAPPPKHLPKPEGVLSPLQWQQKNLEQQEEWSDDELEPSSPQDMREDVEVPVYCKACAYEVTRLPGGDCPGCGKAFDPEDLRTISLLKPMIVSEAAHRRKALYRKIILWSVISLSVFVIAVVLLTCMGVIPGPNY
jgi:hypothetical protein